METEAFIILGAPILLFLILVLFWYTAQKPTSKWKEKICGNLAELTQKAKSEDTNTLQSVLIDADKLLDHTMKMKSIKGENMGGRLKNAQKYYEWDEYQKIWEAHKYRNKLVHEVGIKVAYDKLQSHFLVLKKSIQKLIG